MPRTSRKTAAKETAPVSFKWNAGFYLGLSDKDEGDKVVKEQIELAVDLEYLLKKIVKPIRVQEHCQSELREVQGKLDKVLLLKGGIYQDYKKGVLNKEEYL